MSWTTNDNKAAVHGQPITAQVTWQLSVATLVVTSGQNKVRPTKVTSVIQGQLTGPHLSVDMQSVVLRRLSLPCAATHPPPSSTLHMPTTTSINHSTTYVPVLQLSK